jgi:hypothetical protein
MAQRGLGEIGFCDKGTLSSTKTDPIAMGIRSNAKIEIADYNSVPLYRAQEGRNLVNRKITDLETFQPTMFMLKKFIEWSKAGCDIQAIAKKQSSSVGSEDVFPFIGNNILGVEFEYVISHEKRSLKAIPEGAIEYEDHLTFMDAADSVAAVDLGFSDEGRDEAKYKHPWFFAIEVPDGTDLSNRFNTKSRILTIKSKQNKTAYNLNESHYLEFMLDVIIESPSIAEVVAILNKAMSPSILLKEKNNSAGTLYDAFSFAAGKLTQKIDPLIIGDEQREVTVKYKGEVAINDIAFAFGAGNGGDVADTTGLKGGTLSC